MPRKQVWDRHSIKAAIARKGFTLSALAEQYGLEASAVRTSLCRPMPRADKVIAHFLGVSKHVLWPERYTQYGRRIYSPRKRSRVSQRKSSQKCGQRTGNIAVQRG